LYLCSQIHQIINNKNGRLPGGQLQTVKAGNSGKAANPFAANTISRTKKGLAQ